MFPVTWTIFQFITNFALFTFYRQLQFEMSSYKARQKRVDIACFYKHEGDKVQGVSFHNRNAAQLSFDKYHYMSISF